VVVEQEDPDHRTILAAIGEGRWWPAVAGRLRIPTTLGSVAAVVTTPCPPWTT
jgi:hypothetical protein